MLRFVILLLSLLSSQVFAANASTYIPTKAYPILPIIRDEIKNFKMELLPHYVASSIEKESCVVITGDNCYSPKAQLLTFWDKAKTKERERGVGLGQITRVIRQDGTVRMDVLTELTQRYPTQLKGLTWKNVRERPDLQVKAKLLLMNETFSKLSPVKDVEARHSMSVSAYNSGYGRLSKDRQTCKLAAKCNELLWFDNVEKIKAPGFSTTPLYGWPSAHALNRNHVKEIIKLRAPKYKKWYSEN